MPVKPDLRMLLQLATSVREWGEHMTDAERETVLRESLPPEYATCVSYKSNMVTFDPKLGDVLRAWQDIATHPPKHWIN